MDLLFRILRDLGINESIFIMFLIAILTFFVLKYQLYFPVRKVLAQRDRIVEDAESETSDKSTAAEEKSRRLEEELRKARSEANALREQIKTEAEAKGGELTGRARTRFTEEIERVERELEPVVSRAREDLRTEASSMAELIAQKILSGSAAGQGGKP